MIQSSKLRAVQLHSMGLHVVDSNTELQVIAEVLQ
jgi:hypothetical protein